jgi:RNA polymerase sigma-70 factor (ECF subfamily)
MPSQSSDLNDAYPATHSSLLSRMRDPGDGKSWAEFHQQYRGLVMRVIQKAGLGAQDAEDVAQEALAAVAKAIPDFVLDRTKGSFRGWLYRITSNKLSDFLRTKYRRHRHLHEGQTSHLEAQADPIDLMEKAWDGEWQAFLLERALERVKEQTTSRAFQIFHLSAVKQWSTEQIMENLGINRTSIYLARYRLGLLVKKEIAKLRRELDNR